MTNTSIEEGEAPADAAGEGDSSRSTKKRRLEEMISDKGKLTTKGVVYSSNNKLKGTAEPQQEPKAGEKNSDVKSPLLAAAAAEKAPEAASATKPDGDEGEDELQLDDKWTFPQSLMFLLQNEVEPGALWWQKDGLSFGFEPKLFTAKVLNKLFPIRIKFESLIRKLNRWGFRRVPGQGLPPGGAAYKHPLFQKTSPDLMKSMKFGQKVDHTRRFNQCLNADPAAAVAAPSSASSSQQPSNQLRQASIHQASAGIQDAQHLALMQTMTSNTQQAQQLQSLRSAAAGTLGQQRFATSLAASFDPEYHLRSRLLLGNTIPSLQLATSIPQPLQGLAVSPTGRRLSIPQEIAEAAAALMAEQDLRNTFIFGSTVDLHRRLSLQSTSQTDAANPTTSALEALRSYLDSARATHLEAARNLLGSTVTSQQQQQNVPVQHINHAARLPSGATTQQLSDQLALLRQQRLLHQQTASANTGNTAAELLLLLEQERLRRQNSRSHNS